MSDTVPLSETRNFVSMSKLIYLAYKSRIITFCIMRELHVFCENNQYIASTLDLAFKLNFVLC